MSGRVYTDGGEVVLCTGAGEPDHEWATAMDPEAAEEMAHALLLCAHAARGFPIDERTMAMVRTWRLR